LLRNGSAGRQGGRPRFPRRKVRGEGRSREPLARARGQSPQSAGRGGRMNSKFVVSSAVMAVLSLVLGFIVHGWLLAPDYKALANLFRPESDQASFFPFIIIAHILIGIAFTWIYLKGREAKPYLQQGVRFGAAVALLTVIPMYLIYYAVQPMPGN